MASKGNGTNRQASFKQRMQAAGFRQMNVWVREDRYTELRGIAEALRLHPRSDFEWKLGLRIGDGE